MKNELNDARNPQTWLVVALLGVPVALMTARNPLLTLADGAAFCLIWWGATTSAVKTVVACLLSIQWVSASVKLWLANILEISLVEPSTTRLTTSNVLEVTPYTSDAIFLALCAIVAVSMGIRVWAPDLRLSAAHFARLAPERLALLYFPLLLISQVAGPYFGGGLAMFVFTVGAMRFAPVVLLIGVWFHSKRGGPILAAIFGAEIIVGFLGFFSDWKSIFILTAITVLSLAGSAWRRSLSLLLAGVASLLLLGTLWTTIKPHYRESLSQGTGQQVVLLSPVERVATLSTEFGNVGPGDLSEGFLDLLMRLSYVDYLADVLEYVPARIEHQNGGLWGEAFEQLAMPRILFPEKPPLPSASERTMRYTGQTLASVGTSISIGYVGESYIDFGFPGALIFLFVMGLAYAAGVLGIVRLGRGQKDAPIGLALSISFLWPLQSFENTNMTLVGAAVWTWITCALIIAIAWPRIEPFLLTRNTAIAHPHFSTN